MADDTEVLDWGNEEEERNIVGGVQRSFAPEEDAISLGGDEEDEFLAHQSRVPQGAKLSSRDQTPSKPAESSGKDVAHTDTRQRRATEPVCPDTPPKHSEDAPQQPSGLTLSLPLGKLTHALPAKPVVSLPFVHPSHPAIIEATAMASHSDRNKRNGGTPNARSHDNGDSLPSGWEIKWSRSTGEVYYYNTRTQESTWTCPGSPSFRETHGFHSEDPLDRGFSSRNGDIPSRTGRPDGGDLSYDDRHYRPADNGRRDDRSTQTHTSGDSYQVSNRQNVPSSPLPSRTRVDERGPPGRRPHSPSSGRDSVQGTHRETPTAAALSAQDRIWIASDVIVQPRERERRQHDSGVVPSDHDRRQPRDTEKSSTLRSRSPVIYTRDPEDVEKPYPSSKPAQPVPNSSAPRYKSRFSQPATSRRDQKQSDSRDGISHQLHGDAPTSYRAPVDVIPEKGPPTGPRSLPNIKGNSTVPPAMDTQRSRKRTPLPPQSAMYREGPRSSDLDTGYTTHSSVADVQGESLRERDVKIAHADSDILASNHRGPQLTSMRGPFSLPLTTDGGADHTERDRPRNPRLGKSRGFGDSYVPNESSIPQERYPDSMDIDNAPPRPSDLQRHLPRRPPTGEERGGHPTLNSTSARDPTEPGRPRAPLLPERPRAESSSRGHYDELPRSAPVKDNFPEDRYGSVGLPQRDSARPHSDTRAPPAAPGVRLSGTNNIPIGTRNKPLSNTPPLPQSNRSLGTVISGSNTEPMGSHPRVTTREGPPPTSDVDGHRGPELSGLRRQSPLFRNLSLPTEVLIGSSQSLRVAKSRFGPPVIKDAFERPCRDPSPESPRSVFYPPEDGSRVTPPPPSRESSMTSVVHYDRSLHDHLPHRPSHPDVLLPHRSSSHRSDDGYFRTREGVYSSPICSRPPPSHAQDRDEAESHSSQKRDVPPHLPVHRRRAVDSYTLDSTKEFKDTEGDHYVARPLPVALDVNYPNDRTEARPTRPLMHPERAMLLQHGLPPRPQVDPPQSHSSRAPRRDRLERGGRRFLSSSLSPDRRHPVGNHGSSGRGSLLDRLAPDGGEKMSTFRDRVQVPIKRDREEMMSGDLPMDQDYDGSDGQKRVRKRSTKSRRPKPLH